MLGTASQWCPEKHRYRRITGQTRKCSIGSYTGCTFFQSRLPGQGLHNLGVATKKTLLLFQQGLLTPISGNVALNPPWALVCTLEEQSRNRFRIFSGSACKIQSNTWGGLTAGTTQIKSPVASIASQPQTTSASSKLSPSCFLGQQCP